MGLASAAVLYSDCGFPVLSAAGDGYAQAEDVPLKGSRGSPERGGAWAGAPPAEPLFGEPGWRD